MSFIYNKIEYHLNNFVGSINLLGANKAPKLRNFYSTTTSFHLSTLYSRRDHDPSHFEYNIRAVLNQMKLQRNIYDSTMNVSREKGYFILSLRVSPLFSTPEVLNVDYTAKSQAEWEDEWNSIKSTYAELLV